MRHEGRQLLHIGHDLIDAGTGRHCAANDGAVRVLERSQQLDSTHQIRPGWMAHQGARCTALGGRRTARDRPGHEVAPQSPVV